MARALILLPPALTSLDVAGRTLPEHYAWLGAQAGLEVTVADPTEHGADPGPALLVDGVYPALHADSLRTLADALHHEGGVLLAPQGEILAAAVPRVPGDRPLAEALRQAVGVAQQVASRDESLPIDPSPGPAEAVIRRRWLASLRERGVRFVEPDRILVDTTVRIGPHTTVWPGSVLRGATRIGDGAQIQAGAWLEDTEVADGAVIRPYTVATRATIGPGAQVGPFAHLREGAVLEGSTKVGNYVEVKKATLRRGAKASHLAYLGDAEIGAGANVGAGTITCNYDGVAKHRTSVGAGAFIGSNAALVAPVSVGDDAIVGAGSVVVRDVPDGALYVERASPRVLEGRASSIRRRNELRAERSEDP